MHTHPRSFFPARTTSMLRPRARWALLNKLAIVLLPVVFGACSGNGEPDAFGNFEAEEVVVAAEAPGQILRLDALEGRVLAAGEEVGLIDTTQLALERDQLAAQRRALAGQQALYPGLPDRSAGDHDPRSTAGIDAQRSG